MNTMIWQDCATKAIEMLADVGINTVTSSRTMMKLNAYFRVNEMLDVPFVRVSREPKLFSCFPDIISDLVKYYNQKISEGCMSTELVLSKLTNVIDPKHFDIHIEEQKANHQIILDYDMLFHALNLKKVYYATVWNWLSHLGYKYDINNKSYYTDGHERADVVDDRNNRFLIHYYEYEQQCYRWIQITETDAVQLEKEEERERIWSQVIDSEILSLFLHHYIGG